MHAPDIVSTLVNAEIDGDFVVFLIGMCVNKAIHSGMPPCGLGRVGHLVDAAGSRESARQRMRPMAPGMARQASGQQ
jgi:hypothetical protein